MAHNPATTGGVWARQYAAQDEGLGLDALTSRTGSGLDPGEFGTFLPRSTTSKRSGRPTS